MSTDPRLVTWAGDIIGGPMEIDRNENGNANNDIIDAADGGGDVREDSE